MKTITLKEAYSILEEASAIIIDGSVVTYPSLSDLEDDDTNEFMYLTWDDEGQVYELKFNEGDNQKIIIVGSSMFLHDTNSDGIEDHIQITILTTKELE